MQASKATELVDENRISLTDEMSFMDGRLSACRTKHRI